MGGESRSEVPTSFVPRDDLVVFDLDAAVRQVTDPASPHYRTGALFILRHQLEQALEAGQRRTAVLMCHQDQHWLMPPEVWATQLDDEEWIQIAEPVLATEPLRVVSPGVASDVPAVVSDGPSIVGAWLPSTGVGADANVVPTRSHDDRHHEHERPPPRWLPDEAAGDAPTVGEYQQATRRPAGAARPLESQVREQLAAHNQLRDALARERELRDDAEAVELLGAAGRRVLGSVEALLENDDLWAKFATADREPLTRAEIGQLERLNDAGLSGLLTGLGYREPPPVGELVNVTLTALALAHGSPAEARGHERRVARARRDLTIFAIRLRRLVSTSETQLPPSLGRRVLQVADREADVVMTAIAPVVLEALGNILFPGAGVAVKLGAAVGGVVSARLLAQRARPGPLGMPPETGDARENVGHAIRELAQVAPEHEEVDLGSQRSADDLIAQLWVVDEAIRLALETEEDHGSASALEGALSCLRAARRAAMEGRSVRDDVRSASEQIAYAFGA